MPCRAPKIGIIVQTVIAPQNMGIYPKNEKKQKQLGLGPKSLTLGMNERDTLFAHQPSDTTNILTCRSAVSANMNFLQTYHELC